MTTFYIAVLVCSVLILVAALSSTIAFRFGAPLLLLFLGVGLAAGTDGLGIDFDNDALTFYVGSLALAVILFDAGFGTSLKVLRAGAAPALLLATVGVAATAAMLGAVAMVVTDLSFMQGFLLGSIVASTDAAAVFFLMRVGGVRVVERVGSALEVESGMNDPMAIFLTMTLVTILSPSQPETFAVIPLILHFFSQVGFGLVFGLIGGMIVVLVANRFGINRGLTPILVLAVALLVFSATSTAGGSGYLAVYVAGLYAGNKQVRFVGAIRRFQDGMTWLAQIIMFLLLGLLATPSHFPEIFLPAIALALFLVFIARPLAVWLCLLPFNYRPRETKFIAWIGLRGAVSILLAILPSLYGLENAGLYFNVVFVMVIVSLTLQGWTLAPVARHLKLVRPKPPGPLENIEIDLPGSAGHELLVYHLVEGAPVLEGTPIPRWAMPSLIIRNGQSMRYFYAGNLMPGDYLYMFAAPGTSPLLDRLFADPKPLDAGQDPEIFGAELLLPERPVKELRSVDETINLPTDEENMSLAEYMKKRLGGQPVVADRFQVGSLWLIVRDTDENNEVSAIGIWKQPVRERGLPIFMNFRQLMHRFFSRASSSGNQADRKD
ncbi:potassium/proton antiporter [Martelella mediterranea]|uniref:Potassium/proton antiporter (CPA1 family) n=1 Tax=Martelella mediterranea TaxID=293089 RepID=A0A4R3NWY0_9HYPH|nr:potassium/proton antiporter [Martelella mediterranea]TCT42848.1 potassium/proton antiporter (CPA1 family) [Martelella mediterranea]